MAFQTRRSHLSWLALAAMAFGLALFIATVGPAGASHTENPRNGIEELGFNGFGNQGFNTDVWTQVTADGRLFGYNGTWGTLTVLGAPVEGDACPSEVDPLTQKSGVKIVDVTDPANPTLAARIGTFPGSQNNDVKVTSVNTAAFQGDVLVHSLEPCGVEGILHQIPGSPFIDFVDDVLGVVDASQTGFEVYDVTEPTGPVHLGTWNNGGIGTHNLYVFNRPDLERAFAAAVWNFVDFLGVETDEAVKGELQIVEITDPTDPTLVATWRLEDGGLTCPARGNDSAFCFLHDVWTSDDGKTAYLSFWDAGLILLDISDPATPVFLGQALGQVQLPGDPNGWLNEEGNTHAAVPMTVEDRQLVIVGDEDFTGGGEIGVTINSPANLAAFHKATQWDGTAPATGQTADLVYAGTGCFPTDYTTATAIHGKSFVGKIALVDKFDPQPPFTSTCPTFLFKQKMEAAEAAGAIGLVQIDNNDAPSGGNAIQSDIPGLEISNSAGVPIRNAVLAGTTVNATLGRGGAIDPWGFMRVVDVSDPNPANWREVSQFKAPHVEDALPGLEDVFSAHNPIVGPDGRIYFAWYTDGVRVLEMAADGAPTEVAWFVPLPGDHPDDNDSDPHGAQEDNVGFWGSKAVCHPGTGDLLILNTDLNRGMYVLRANYQHSCAPEPRPPSKAMGGGQIPGSTDDGSASFGFNVRMEGDQAEGHISVLDHGTGQRILSASITSVTEPEGVVTVQGTCRVNGGALQPCTVRAIDNGEPGNTDEFHIEVGENGMAYSAGGTLERGNVQIN